MNIFYPFIHERKKKNWEPLPLYIEQMPQIEPVEEKEDKEQNQEIIIIELT